MCYTKTCKSFGDIPKNTERAFKPDPVRRKKRTIKKTQKASPEKTTFE